MLDISSLQSLGKVLFLSNNILYLFLIFAIYGLMRNRDFDYKYTLLGFLLGLMALPIYGGIFALLNKYGAVWLFVVYTVFIFAMIKAGFSIINSILYAIALLIIFLLLVYAHFIPISFFKSDKNIFTDLAVLGVVYGIIYALFGYIIDSYVSNLMKR